MKLRILATALAAALSACGSDSTSGVCTEMFATIPVTIVDAAGQPVEAATLTTVLVRTGQVLVPTTLMLSVPGTYTLADDGSTSFIRRSGDAVQAHITKGEAAITVDYVLAVEGGCHISKISGPDTVTLP